MDRAPSDPQARGTGATNDVVPVDRSTCAATTRETATAQQAKPGDAHRPPSLHPALIALARLLARQAAREALGSPPGKPETQDDVEEDR